MAATTLQGVSARTRGRHYTDGLGIRAAQFREEIPGGSSAEHHP